MKKYFLFSFCIMTVFACSSADLKTTQPVIGDSAIEDVSIEISASIDSDKIEVNSESGVSEVSSPKSIKCGSTDCSAPKQCCTTTSDIFSCKDSCAPSERTIQCDSQSSCPKATPICCAKAQANARKSPFAYCDPSFMMESKCQTTKCDDSWQSTMNVSVCSASDAELPVRPCSSTSDCGPDSSTCCRKSSTTVYFCVLFDGAKSVYTDCK